MSDEPTINGNPMTQERLTALANYSVFTVLQERGVPMTVPEIADKAGMSVDAAEAAAQRLYTTGELLPLDSLPILWIVSKW